jgi:uncharacterized protein YjbI with pentapeptide repeats
MGQRNEGYTFAPSKSIKKTLMETNTIGNKITKARKKVNLSQAQLAEQLFISPQAVGKWERGESIPDIMTMNRLAKILGTDLNYFSEDPGDDERSFKTLNENTGDTQQTAQTGSPSPGRELITNFSGSNLPETDFAGVTAHKRTFNGSALRGSSFAGADLTGSSFAGSDAQEANFDGANLSDCSFSAVNLSGASFNKSILLRSTFSASELSGTKFTDATFTDVKLTATDLKDTIFENCLFTGVDFKSSDMRGLCLDKQTFIGVRFNKASLNDATFRGATFKNVSFRPTYALTNKYYRAIATICFDEATMDKLTYAELKGFGADLSKVTLSK